MTDQLPATAKTDRLYFFDPTSSLNRPQVITHYGPSDEDKFPDRIRPLMSQVIIAVVGWVLMFVSWYYVWQAIMPPWTGATICIVVPLLAARYHKRIRVDGRSIHRTGRSELAHRLKSGGKSVGRWYVHGQPIPQTRRAPKPVAPTYIPVEGDW